MSNSKEVFNPLKKFPRRTFLKYLFASGVFSAWAFIERKSLINMLGETMLSIDEKLEIRPPREAYVEQISTGMQYARKVEDFPRPLMIHIVTIDLSNPNIQFLVTPTDTSNFGQIRAQTTSDFLETFNSEEIAIAVNANFFGPFSRAPFFSYPNSGDVVEVHGLSISEGRLQSSPRSSYPTLCLIPSSSLGSMSAEISGGEDCSSPNTEQAVSGNNLLVKGGVNLMKSGGPVQPRTAIGITDEGSQSKLVIVVIDGRQAKYSEGATLHELAQILIKLGVKFAINLDGGGSSALAIRRAGEKIKLLNSPIDRNVWGNERPVGNHLIVGGG